MTADQQARMAWGQTIELTDAVTRAVTASVGEAMAAARRRVHGSDWWLERDLTARARRAQEQHRLEHRRWQRSVERRRRSTRAARRDVVPAAVAATSASAVAVASGLLPLAGGEVAALAAGVGTLAGARAVAAVHRLRHPGELPPEPRLPAEGVLPPTRGSRAWPGLRSALERRAALEELLRPAGTAVPWLGPAVAEAGGAGNAVVHRARRLAAAATALERSGADPSPALAALDRCTDALGRLVDAAAELLTSAACATGSDARARQAADELVALAHGLRVATEATRTAGAP